MSKPSLWSESGSGHDWIAAHPPTIEPPSVERAPAEQRGDRGPLWSRIEVQLLVACGAGAVVGALTQVLR